MSMQIKWLADQCVPKAQIAAQLNVSRQTVYNHLKRGVTPFPKPRPPRNSKLDGFKSYLRSRLENFDLPATVLLREIRDQGYTGGLTVLRDFVRPLRKELIRRVTERFETVPGQQAQMDWGECGTIDVDGERRTLYVFVLVLGYSRMMYARFTTSSKLPVLLGCMRRAFQMLGIPAEVLVDNMKQAVDQHDVTTGVVRWNRQFLDFAEHHGFLPVASPPYWPRVKGKVERGVGYIKVCFLEGRTFSSLDDLNRQLASWLAEVANVRVHGTTGERPVDRHARELHKMSRLAALPAYDTRSVELRQVHPDCHISYRGVFYSVDPVAVGRSVTIRAEGDVTGSRFSVYLGDRVVAEHILRAKRAGRITLYEHLAAIRQITRGDQDRRSRRRASRPRFVQTPVLEVQEARLSDYEQLVETAA
jgi:transposase